MKTIDMFAFGLLSNLVVKNNILTFSTKQSILRKCFVKLLPAFVFIFILIFFILEYGKEFSFSLANRPLVLTSC